MSFRTLLLLTLSLLLTACAVTTPPTVVRDKELVYVTIPEHLTRECTPERPTSKQLYMQLKPHEREEVLADYAISLLGTIKDCNNKLAKIQELNRPLK